MNVDVEFLSDDEIYQRLMKEDIPAARRSVLIVTALVKQMSIEIDRGESAPFAALADRLIERGVAVNLLLAGRPSRPFLASLRKYPRVLSNMGMMLCARNHMKVVLIDDEKLYLGSANLTGAGMGARGRNKRNFEFGLFTRDRTLITRVSRMVRQIWEGEHCSTCRVKKFCDGERATFLAGLAAPPEEQELRREPRQFRARQDRHAQWQGRNQRDS